MSKKAKVKASEADTAPLLPQKVERECEGDDYNVFCCSRNNCLRVLLFDLVRSSTFDLFILLIICFNCVLMANSSPLVEAPAIFETLEFIFNVIFTAEMTLKIIAYGLTKYLEDGWNMLDVLVVTTAWLPYVFPNAGNYSAIRAVRVLRALRTVNRIPSLKKIINTLVSSIKDLYNVSLLFAFFLFLFGIIGVYVFSGKLHRRCTEAGASEFIDDAAICEIDADCDGTQTCVHYPGNPSNGAVSYDNCLWAFITIFQAVSLEGWVDQMYMLERVVEPKLVIAYYICLVVFGAMFIVNLFLAVIFDAFLQGKEEEENDTLAEAEEMAKKRQDVEVKGWDAVVYMLIVANTVSMCLEFQGMSAELEAILNMANLFFTTVFALEMAIKLRIHGLRGPDSYFASGWNVFDFLVTNASLLDLLLDLWHHDTDFLRALRVARVLRLLRLNRNMQRFEYTFVKVSVPVVNMSGVLVLIMVVFAMLGMELFGGKLGAEPPRTNFDYFSASFITTFVVTSGENWNDVFADSLDVGSPLMSVAFFVPLFIIGNYVLVNLFVAIICWGWDSAAPDVDTGGPETEEERAIAEKYKTELNHHRSALQGEHADLMQLLQDLISERALGFSATFGLRLMSQMMSSMKEFDKAIDDAPQLFAHELEELDGIVLGFASLVQGLGQLLDDGGAGAARTPQISLLCEYWDSEHVRTSGAPAGTTSVKNKLHLSLKKYITTITANKKLMKVVADVRISMRDLRVSRGVDERSVPYVARVWKDVGTAMPQYGTELLPTRSFAEAISRGKCEFSPSEFVKFGLGEVESASFVKLGKLYWRPVGKDEHGADYLPLKADGVTSGPCIRQLRAIVTSNSFSNFIMLCIISSSLALAFDMPDVRPGSETAITLELLDYLFTTIFVVEMGLKIIAFGACSSPDGYFRDGWNILDSFIVFTSVLSLLASGVEFLSVFRSMRAVRTLRPLRVIQRNPGLKQVVNSFLRAIPGMWSVTQVCTLVYIVYGRFMMQFLSGRMGSCNDESVATKEACIGTFVSPDSGVTLPRWWGNADIGNFDNIFYAVLTLFEMSTLEMWPDLLFRAVDADPEAVNQPLRLNANPWMAVYVCVWIVISAFFLLNLFVGVVLENFDAVRKQEDGSALMDDEQKEWKDTMTKILSIKPEKALRPPNGKSTWSRFRRRMYMLVQGDPHDPNDPKRRCAIAFEKFVITLVLLNVLSMSLTWYGQPSYMNDFAEAADIFFTIVFTLEMLIKLAGLGLRQYLRSWWNRFDAVLVNGALVADALQGLEQLGVAIDPATLRMLRVFRIMRLLRLMKVSKGLNRLITTIFVSVPALGNVGILLFIFMYIYTVLGVELFHNLPLTGDFINEDANFNTFGRGMMTLLRCVTGESYNGLMHDAMITEKGSAPGRCSDADGTCGSPVAAVIFFISFFILESLVMLNLIVAVVLEAFADEEAAQEMKLPGAAMEQFIEAWKDLDHEASNFIDTKNLKTLLEGIDCPHGFADWKEKYGREPTAHEVTDRLVSLAIPDRSGRINFYDVLEALGRVALGNIALPAGSSAERALRSKYADVLKSTGLHNSDVSSYSSYHIFFVTRVQKRFRRRRAQRQFAANLAQAKAAAPPPVNGAAANGLTREPTGGLPASRTSRDSPPAAKGASPGVRGSFDSQARKQMSSSPPRRGGTPVPSKRSSRR